MNGSEISFGCAIASQRHYKIIYIGSSIVESLGDSNHSYIYKMLGVSQNLYTPFFTSQEILRCETNTGKKKLSFFKEAMDK